MPKLVRQVVWYWFPVIIWAGMIFWFSSRPTLPGPHDYWVNFFIKKVLHVVEYGVLALLVYRADVASRRDARSSGGVAFWVAVIYAITDEIHQIFVPGREATIRDFLIDALGAFLAGLFIKRNKKVPLSR